MEAHKIGELERRMLHAGEMLSLPGARGWMPTDTLVEKAIKDGASPAAAEQLRRRELLRRAEVLRSCQIGHWLSTEGARVIEDLARELREVA